MNKRIALLLAVPTLLICVATASAAKTNTSMAPSVTAQFLGHADPSSIYAGNVVPFTLLLNNGSDESQSGGSIVFPAWVRLGAPSDRHLIYNKAGQLVWRYGTIAPGHNRILTIPVIVSTAWDKSQCPMGDWHISAYMYDVHGIKRGTAYECYALNQS